MSVIYADVAKLETGYCSYKMNHELPLGGYNKGIFRPYTFILGAAFAENNSGISLQQCRKAFVGSGSALVT